MLEIGKLIVSHTVITIESHHTHVLLSLQGNLYDIGNHRRVICSGSHIFAMFYDVAHTIEGVSQVLVCDTTGRYLLVKLTSSTLARIVHIHPDNND